MQLTDAERLILRGILANNRMLQLLYRFRQGGDALPVGNDTWILDRTIAAANDMLKVLKADT